MDTPTRKNPFSSCDTESASSSLPSDHLDASGEQKLLYSLSLKEFAPLSYLLSLIPAKAQRAFTKFDIDFVCLDAHPKWIAIGSSIGTLFLYERYTGKLSRLRYQDYIGKVTSVRFSSSSTLAVAFGIESGLVLTCQVPEYDDPLRKLECAPVSTFHTSRITSLDWSHDNMQIFSGCANGLVVSSHFDPDKLSWTSNVLVQENSGIVQMKFHASSVLSISTMQRCILCHVENGKQYKLYQVGKKDRKVAGEFGCVFDPLTSNSNCVKVFTARPGMRLWKANAEGVVLETLLMKDSCLAAKCQPSIQILNPLPDAGTITTEGEQFGKMFVFQALFILTWNSDAIYIIDPEMRGIISSTQPGGLSNIVDVAVSGDEIFVLQGKRNIRRLGASPEEDFHIIPVTNDDMKFSFNIPNPFQDIVREHSSSNVLDWLGLKTVNPKDIVEEEPEAKLAPPVDGSAENVTPHCAPEDGLGPGNMCSVNNQNALLSNSEIKGPAVPDSQSENEELVDSAAVVYLNKRHRKKHKKVKKLTTNVPGKVSIELEDQSPKPESVLPVRVPVPIPSPKGVKANEDDILAHILGNYDSFLHEAQKENTEQKVSTPEEPSTVEELKVVAEASHEEDSISDNIEINSNTTMQEENNIGTEDIATKHEKAEEHTMNSPEPDIYHDGFFDEHPKLCRQPDVLGLSEDSTEDIVTVPEGDTGEEWVQYKSPSTKITSLAVTKTAVYITDSKENLFYSLLKGPGLHWYSINHPAEQVSVSSCGNLMWILYRQSAYAVKLNTATGGIKGKWTEAAQRVALVALDINCAWFVKDSGELKVQQGLSPARTCFKTQSVPFPVGVPARMSCEAGVLWVLTQKGKPYATSLTPGQDSSSSSLNVSWREILVPEHVEVSAISLGPQGVGWMVEPSGKIWFKEGVSISRPQGQNSSWQVSVDITTQRTWKSMSSVKELPLLSASVRGLWMYFGNLLWASRGNITGHNWDKINSNSNWLSLAVSDSSQGALWIVSHPGELLCQVSRHSKPTSVSLHPDVTRSGSFPVCLAPFTSALWLLCSSGSIWARTGISPPTCMEGSNWARVDLSQIGDCKLAHISCGKNIVWACDSSGCVWARVGPITPTKRGLEPAWIMVSDVDSSESVPHFLKVHVSNSGLMVWGIERRSHCIYVREGVSPDYPIGRHWVQVPDLQAQFLALSDTAVYAISLYGAIFKRLGIHLTQNPIGHVWKHLLGIPICQSISVTVTDDLWVLDQSGGLLQFVSTTVQHNTKDSVHQHLLLNSSFEDVTVEGWEMICTVDSC